MGLRDLVRWPLLHHRTDTRFDERDSRSFSLFYDVEIRSLFNPIVLFSEQEVIGRILSPATSFEEPDATDAQWWPLVEGYCKSKGIEITGTQH